MQTPEQVNERLRHYHRLKQELLNMIGEDLGLDIERFQLKGLINHYGRLMERKLRGEHRNDTTE